MKDYARLPEGPVLRVEAAPSVGVDLIVTDYATP
jgi:hypothetical protein